jgi:hypothetical protein
VEGGAPGQVSWLPDRPTPRAFPARCLLGQWLHAGFVPGYSDGVAADSHRLPWGPRLAGRPDTNDAVTVPDQAHTVKRVRHASRPPQALLPIVEGLSAEFDLGGQLIRCR